ncbi:hypothetical protein D9757_001368 [Collybiopsis confluens]|uniref:Zinc finger PHD-type domain-containing protein n=1 Tax=Collybiopsis confluens TaxID=2823264 RepID=A0A8H5HZ99_9AGAR|nr:hypothetical protein D9757_001368 [Collybiopsis confluens]
MPRRPSARNAASAAPSIPSEPLSALALPQSLHENLAILRKHWKWAAFSQFFFTFAPMLAMDDVTIKDVEDDLYLGSSLVLPRIMVKLLYTLSYDRKVNLHNWQTTLRRQHNKRNPKLNPIGPEPFKEMDDSRYIYQAISPEPESIQNQNDGAAATDGPGQLASTEQDETSKLKYEDSSLDPATRQQSLANDPSSDDSSQQESKDWLSLSMLEKLDSLFLLTEWQFQSPHRVRTLMKTDDDQASWRIEPIGYDAKRNAYWLIGADRLWIQRVPPKPPRPPPKKSLKRKRATISKPPPTKRARTQTTAKGRKARSKPLPATPSNTSSGRHGRAAKDQANLKLDAQAKQLAELNRQAGLLATSPRNASSRGKAAESPSRVASSRTARPLGTRISARLRGAQDEDEWQVIPDEWLQDDNDDEYQGGMSTRSRRALSPSRSIANSSMSDLTELSDESDEKAESEEDEDGEEEEEESENQEDDQVEQEVEQEEAKESLPQDFVEWETIAVTLFEWEHIAERWNSATHYSEKALYKVLTNHIIPVIEAELREADAQRQKEEAVTHRKRSSRLAIKENEKEEARLAVRQKVEEEEKMSRSRRLEMRQQREEAEREKRETAREQRRKERETREQKEAKEAEERERKEREKERKERDRTERTRTRASSKREASNPSSVSNGAVLLHHLNSNVRSVSGSAQGSRSSRTPAGDDWELDCEICNRHGINLDDGVPLMCCGLCAKWQHIPCHDRADMQAGRSRRNWDQVEFICRQCRVNNQRTSSVQMHYPQTAPINIHPSLRSVPGSSSYSNQVPYGQGLSYEVLPRLNNGGYLEVASMNGGKGYSAQGYANPTQQQQPPKQISFSHYQPQRHGFQQNNNNNQRQYQTTPSTYGQTNHGNHGSPNNVEQVFLAWLVPGWNGYPADPLTYMPGSAERSSAVPESSSRVSHHDQQVTSHYPQHLPQPYQQWQPNHPGAISSSQSLPQSNIPFATTSSSSFQAHHHP